MNLSACFRSRQGAFNLDVELGLPDRGITALFGHSGSGKTTILRAMAGLARAKGYMHLGDHIWQDDAAGILVPTHERPVAYVFQEASLFPHILVPGFGIVVLVQNQSP
ncbi:ATP-binding cassette domain-containing protein [Mariprofundus erugo]|uniref:ATP-binding cassette domain-containing protein n=1 Tax=Mariprofundus erugo TaxID=2528639 RepID=A0A5R9GQL3_9PROT|nr:ATP-binding cassette domain-containing protein [Mariprofundus erugo]TLS65464.1 ATP-binding cassette domain-containing protein [Mariprofundus erugo]